MCNRFAGLRFTVAVFMIALFVAGARVAHGTTDTTCPNKVLKCATIETEQQLEMSADTNAQPWVYTSGYHTAGDGGGGVLYGPPPSGSCAPNGGSCVADMSGHLYQAQTFPTNVMQWGAHGDGMHDATAVITNEALALEAAGGLIYFPPGTFVFSGITLPDQKNMTGNTGAHVLCAGKDVTTLRLAVGANTYMFATHNYVKNETGGATPVEINGCTIDLNQSRQSSAVSGIIIMATAGSSIHDNVIDNGYGAAVEIRSEDSNGFDPMGANCNTAQSGGYKVIHNSFNGSYGPAVKGFDDGCASVSGANGLSDGVIADNSFASNAGGIGTEAADYQVTIDEAAGWRFYDNASFSDNDPAHYSCGELHMVNVASSVINNNKFDISNNKVCTVPVPPPPCGPTVESIVIEMGSSKGFTFSGNSIHDVATGLPTGASCWDALEVKNDIADTSRGTAGDNIFTNKVKTFDLNAIHYHGMFASDSPLVAIGNAFNDNIVAPSPTDPTLILGAGQYPRLSG